MKLIFIRHAEPLYESDSLTEKGFREAQLLGERTRNWPITQVYCSPLGRAQKTAEPTLESHGITLTHVYPDAPEDVLPSPDPKKAIVCPWLREFAAGVDPDEHPFGQPIPWDFTPAYLAAHPELYDRHHWWEAPIFSRQPKNRELPKEIAENPQLQEIFLRLYGAHYDVNDSTPRTLQEYRWVTGRLDDVLAQWGYHRDGLVYRTDPPAAEPTDAFMTHRGQTVQDLREHQPQEEGEPVLLFFCHLGIMDVLLSHLIHVSPSVLHHGYFCAPSSVTVLTADERVPGTAAFRIQVMGDTSHLRDAGEPVSYYGAFSAPFQM